MLACPSLAISSMRFGIGWRRDSVPASLDCPCLPPSLAHRHRRRLLPVRSPNSISSPSCRHAAPSVSSPSLPDHSTRGTGRGLRSRLLAFAVRFRLRSICAGSVEDGGGEWLLRFSPIGSAIRPLRFVHARPAQSTRRTGRCRLPLLDAFILFRNVARCHRLPLRRAAFRLSACPCVAFRVRTPWYSSASVAPSSHHYSLILLACPTPINLGAHRSVSALRAASRFR